MGAYHKILEEKGNSEKEGYKMKHLFVEEIGNIAWGVYSLWSPFDDGSAVEELELLYFSEDRGYWICSELQMMVLWRQSKPTGRGSDG